jgi:hypothetical protein
MAFPFQRWKKKKKLRTTSLKKAPEKKRKKGGPKATSQRWLQSKKNQTLMGPLALMGEEVQLQLQ